MNYSLKFYEMAIIDTCENYRNFSRANTRFLSGRKPNKNCGLYNRYC